MVLPKLSLSQCEEVYDSRSVLIDSAGLSDSQSFFFPTFIAF